MLDLSFHVEGAEPDRIAAAPLMLFKLRIDEHVPSDSPPTPIHAIALNCHLRIEPARRKYTPQEQQRLLDLFGTPERWGQTVRPLVWTPASVVVRPFERSTTVDLPVPCTYDFSLAATKYFDALAGGDIPLCILFNGTVFYHTEERGLQVTQVPWDKEAYYRLTVDDWSALMNRYYPNAVPLSLRKDVFDRLTEYRRQRALPTWEDTIESLLGASKEVTA